MSKSRLAGGIVVEDLLLDSVIEIRAKDLTTAKDYLRTGKSRHTYQGGAIVRDKENDPFLLKDGEFFDLTPGGAGGCNGDDVVITNEMLSESNGFRASIETFDGRLVDVPAGVLISGGPKGWKYTALLSGDDGAVIVMEDAAPAVTISFLCLGRFIDDADPIELAAMLHSGKIKVLDSTKDVTRKTSAADRKKFKADEPVSPPAPGFTYLDFDPPVWHYAATVLLRYGRMRIILGQDDGTYFGCELRGTPNTVKVALESLMPEDIRKVKGVRRQGEWFVVPVDEKNVPVVTECMALGEVEDSRVSLPVDDEDSARHTVHSNDIRIGTDGRIYAFEGTLRHNDHPNVSMKDGRHKWHAFHRNTAVRSFSQEGVD